MSRKGLNIYKRKDGRWEARYIKSRNALGKPKYGYLYASSYREVRCDLQHTLQLQGKPSGSEERTRNSTFELVSMEWLDAFSINFKESTYIRYRTLIECYLMPSFQTVKIEKITKEMVRKLCKHLELHGKKDKTGLSPKTISDVLSVLRRILNYAGTLGIFVDGDSVSGDCGNHKCPAGCDDRRRHWGRVGGCVGTVQAVWSGGNHHCLCADYSDCNARRCYRRWSSCRAV